MSKRYRQLLPVPSSDSTPSSSHPPGSSSTPRSSSDEPLKRQRIGTQLACNACRKRKTRCDGQRPSCEACRRRGEKEPCTYAESRNQTQSRKETEQILEIFDLLKSGPESQALDILRTLRCHSDLDIALSVIQERSPAVDGVEQEWTPISTKHLGLEYELMARSPVSFPPLQPFESSILKSVKMQSHPVETFLKSSVIPTCNHIQGIRRLDLWLTLSRAHLGTSRASGTDSEGISSSSNSDANSFPARPPTRGPTTPLPLCDGRLEDLDMSVWTSVSIANDLAAQIISLYLETDHPLLGTFDPDLFVGDLVNCRPRYCSQLLISSIMYWGCQMYSGFNPAVKEYVPLFSDEAEKRWSDEKGNDSLLNLAGTQLLGMAYLGDGKDHHILTYIAEANSMGKRMGLFGIEPAVATDMARQITPELQNPTSYAAWGTFNWIVLMSLFYQQPGLSYPDYPPILPIPGHTWQQGPNDSSESVRQSVQSTYMGDTFPVLCRFWRILHEVTLRYYRDQPEPRERPSDHLSLAFAEYKYRELIAWTETLVPSMMRSEDNPHHVLIFHIWLHAAILDILRPFTTRARSAPKPLRLKTFPCKRSSPDAAYRASVNQLKRLIVVYRKNYASSTYTMLWHNGLIQVANAILGDTDDPTWRFYLLFCVQCYRHLRKTYRFAEAIGRSLLSMALEQGDISANEARRMMKHFEENKMSDSSNDIRATFMADLTLAMTDPEEASVENLSDRFEDIALFREFTNQENSDEDELMEDGDSGWATL
ncbi:hypothetical protein FZEAL_7084 [Fusarium zealandicum]|uniref:Zn(2)-C6 fungal-type domain-containing protein n=1 Tax=Fusarium zealandicum TaxID=1053134 RepID=A0A8H4UGJ6_9HYPO|nr:hypothetical protein FZEAL_7084 [Fusarium zealandicum]